MLDRLVVKETPYPERMSWELAEQWADSIPIPSKIDPKRPEWPPTPTLTIDLSPFGYSPVHVKNEAVPSNPTESIKDRPALETAKQYGYYARTLLKLRKQLNGNIESLPVPRFSIITARKAGEALAKQCEKYNLPPIKLLVDSAAPSSVVEELKMLPATDLYIADLSRKLKAKDINRLTNNENGVNLSSVAIIQPQKFYNWHVHEAFNQTPDEIYLPFGSGRLFENYLYWQHKTLTNAIEGTPDPRLTAPVEKVIAIDILAAEPQKTRTSKARALTKAHNPFRIFEEDDISAMKCLESTSQGTGVYKTKEEYIKAAAEILSKYMPTGPSAAAGLALYMQRYDKGLVDPRKKVLIVNTGRDI